MGTITIIGSINRILFNSNNVVLGILAMINTISLQFIDPIRRDNGMVADVSIACITIDYINTTKKLDDGRFTHE